MIFYLSGPYKEASWERRLWCIKTSGGHFYFGVLPLISRHLKYLSFNPLYCVNLSFLVIFTIFKKKKHVITPMRLQLTFYQKWLWFDIMIQSVQQPCNSGNDKRNGWNPKLNTEPYFKKLFWSFYVPSYVISVLPNGKMLPWVLLCFIYSFNIYISVRLINAIELKYWWNKRSSGSMMSF